MKNTNLHAREIDAGLRALEREDPRDDDAMRGSAATIIAHLFAALAGLGVTADDGLIKHAREIVAQAHEEEP